MQHSLGSPLIFVIECYILLVTVTILFNINELSQLEAFLGDSGAAETGTISPLLSSSGCCLNNTPAWSWLHKIHCMGPTAFMAIVTLLSIHALCHVTILLLPRRGRIYSWLLDSRLSLLGLALTSGLLAYTTEEGALQKCLHDCTWPCPGEGHAWASLLVPGGMRFMGAESRCFF